MKQLILAFRGHLERDDSFSYAMGDDAPVFVHGVNDEEALDRFKRGLQLYLNCLAERGELDLIITTGSGHLKLHSGIGPHRLVSLKRDQDRFEVQLAGTR